MTQAHQFVARLRCRGKIIHEQMEIPGWGAYEKLFFHVFSDNPRQSLDSQIPEARTEESVRNHAEPSK